MSVAFIKIEVYTYKEQTSTPRTRSFCMCLPSAESQKLEFFK